MKLIAHTIAAALLVAGSAAGAVTVYSENFTNPGFAGSSLGLTGSEATSDRFGNTNYTFINNFAGWTFSGGTFLAISVDTEQAGMLLNENMGSGISSRLISGLTPGGLYTLTFVYSGDNRPNKAYVLTGGISGVTWSLAGTDLAAGTNPGTTYSVNFTATGQSELLSFGQASVTDASPIVSDIEIATVTAAIPEPSTWAMLLAGFGMVGFAARRRRSVVAA